MILGVVRGWQSGAPGSSARERLSNIKERERGRRSFFFGERLEILPLRTPALFLELKKKL